MKGDKQESVRDDKLCNRRLKDVTGRNVERILRKE